MSVGPEGLHDGSGLASSVLRAPPDSQWKRHCCLYTGSATLVQCASRIADLTMAAREKLLQYNNTIVTLIMLV